MGAWLRPRRLLALAAIAASTGVVAAALLVAAPGESSRPEASARPKAPELEGAVLVPPPVRLADLRGEPVLVNFWASWCLPCREEAPELARFDEEMGNQAQLVGVDFQDEKDDALAFVRRFGWRFPNISDPTGKVAGRYGLRGLPTTYVIDRAGRIAQALTGAQTVATLRDALEEVE